MFAFVVKYIDSESGLRAEGKALSTAKYHFIAVDKRRPVKREQPSTSSE